MKKALALCVFVFVYSATSAKPARISKELQAFLGLQIPIESTKLMPVGERAKAAEMMWSSKNRHKVKLLKN